MAEQDEKKYQYLGAQEHINLPSHKLQTISCISHPTYDLILFCRDCNDLICSKCLTNSHQRHSMCDIDVIHSEKLKVLSNQGDKINKQYLPFVSSEKSKFKEMLSLHTISYESEREKITEKDGKLKDEISKWTSLLLREKEKDYLMAKEYIDKNISLLEEKMKELKSSATLTEEYRKNNNIKNVCHISDGVQNYVEEFVIERHPLPFLTLTFKEESDNACELQNMFGKLEPGFLRNAEHAEFVSEKLSYTTNLNLVGKVSTGENTIWIKNTKKAILQEIKLENEIYIEEEVKDIQIRDMVALKSGELLLILVNNPTIKIRKKGEKKMENFFNFNKSWLYANVFPTTVHVLNNNRVVVGTTEVKEQPGREIITGQVVVLTENGKNIRITSNTNRDIIVLERPQKGNRRLRSLDNEGNIKWDYTGIEIQKQKQCFDPWDVVTTSHDNIITCDFSNENLHILNSKGNVINCIRLTPLDIYRPVSMAIMKNETLIIGCGSTTDNAKIHKLQIRSKE
ncbi:unnamed protein product [Mytilus coruscus]|uniref:B box-type domain-containing protein n=1 Tax=Mytilus coruscus TaxID=42192 RepID=A0A6J8AC35_MYTCO|nr:unnamed protein product [Mytilus coruscus]